MRNEAPIATGASRRFAINVTTSRSRSMSNYINLINVDNLTKKVRSVVALNIAAGANVRSVYPTRDSIYAYDIRRNVRDSMARKGLAAIIQFYGLPTSSGENFPIAIASLNSSVNPGS